MYIKIKQNVHNTIDLAFIVANTISYIVPNIHITYPIAYPITQLKMCVIFTKKKITP